MKQFIVAVPGRPVPLCIEAEDGYLLGDGAEFLRGGKIVASLPDVVLVSESDVLVAFPENVPPFTGRPELACVDLQPGELVQSLEAREASTFTTFHDSGCKPVWPFLSGISLGFIAGVGMALSHLQLW